MSKLEPQVGDKVTLTHASGDTATIVATGTNGYGICGTSNYFSFKEGWSVTEVHEKPKPAPGTFIKGVDDDGDQFVGVVGGELNEHRVVGGFWAAYGYGGTNTWGWEDIREWEVIS